MTNLPALALGIAIIVTGLAFATGWTLAAARPGTC